MQEKYLPFLCRVSSSLQADAEPEAATEETAEENASETNEDNNEAEESGTETDAEASSDEAPAEEASESDTDPSLETAQTQEDIPSPVISTPSRPTQEELLAGDRRTLVGIVLDATRYSVSIQSTDGTSYYLTIPDSGVSGNLYSLTIGQIATFAYAGSLDDTALLVDISDSGLITGIYVEEYAFAIKIINAVKTMNMKALSDLTNFPVFLDTGNYSGPINTSGEFEVIDSEKIFSEALVNRIVNYNLFDLKFTDAGFVLGGNGAPNITFDIDDDGILGIIGINSAPANDSTKD